MSAVRMLARPGLRRRWISWTVLGLLAGVSVGLAAAGVAGARRTDRALPEYVRVAHVPDAAILPNDPAFDDAARDRVAALPEVRAVSPFMVPFAITSARPKGVEPGLLPVGAASQETMQGVIVAGRSPDPGRADEIVVNENVRDRFGLGIGATVEYLQPDPHDLPGVDPASLPAGVGPIRQRLRVVGISDAPDEALDSMPSAGFYAKYHDRILGIVNEFVVLRHGERDIPRLQADVSRIMGHPVNIPAAAELFNVRKIGNVSDLERDGLLLFALAVLVGAGVLVGQALVRAVTASGDALDVWRALGVHRGLAVRTLLLPVTITAAVGAVTAVVVAVVLSPRFPIAVTRRYDLDIGFHADWPVLLGAAAGLVVAVMGSAWIAAELLVLRRGDRVPPRPRAWRTTLVASMPPAMQFGSRLAVEPGHGRRAVPVRSAFVGAIVGVIGVVGCFTFRAGLSDAVTHPSRSGVVWDHYVAQSTEVAPATVRKVVALDGVVAVTDAQWARAVRIAGEPTPTWGTRPLKGDLGFVVLSGRAPRGTGEVALAPTTARDLHLGVGDRVPVGPGRGRSMRVTGIAFVPASSHTDYDQSAWMTAAALRASVPADQLATPDFVEDWLLVKDAPGADHRAIDARLAQLGQADGDHVGPAERSTVIVSLGQLRTLPLALAVFFGLLAIATVAHALVTTVRRRRQDVAVLRTLGFTRPDVRLAIAWQATLIAAVGVVVGVPLGIVAGRVAWRRLAEGFPVAYVSPFALVAVLVVVPLAVVIANVLAAGPAHAATRLHPARVLRTE